MTFTPNPVQHAALENRSAGIVVLHVHFERPHDHMSLGLVFGQIATFMQGEDGLLMNLEIHPGGEIISLIPIEAIGEERHFQAATRALDYEPPGGKLPFIQEGSCQPITNPSQSWQ